MNKLMFVRHAESVGNKNNMLQGQHDYPLTDNGLNSIDKLASSNISKLKEYDSIISSPLTRTKQTANVIKEKTDVVATGSSVSFTVMACNMEKNLFKKIILIRKRSIR